MVARSITRIDPIERDIALMVDAALSPQAQAEVLGDAARSALVEAQEINRQALGYVPSHDLFIDGARRQALSGLTARSTVLFEFHLLVDVIEWIDEQLIIHSPVGRTPKSPEYAKSHVWFADDVEFTDPSRPPPAESYIVLNSQPYSRKIERGQSQQAPDGVYEAVATMARRRFGNIAHTRFTYRSFPGGAIGRWAQSASAQELARRIRKGRASAKQDWLTRQPAIYVDPGR